MRRPRLTIPTRIFLSLVLLLVAFAVVSSASLVQHQRTAARLRLLHEGYLPLAMTIGQAKATQAVFGTLLDRVLQERDPTATRSWLEAARRLRPTTLRRALSGVERAEALGPPEEDGRALAEIRATFEEIQRGYSGSEARFEALFAALEAREAGEAARILDEQRRQEQQIARGLRDAWGRIQDRIAQTSRRAEEQEQQSLVTIPILVLVALSLGVALLWWSQRLLAPLPRLQRRVAAVARGDFAGRIEPARDDELGQLTAEFERMVDAVGARDRQLREAAEAMHALQRMQEQIVAGLRAAVVVVDGKGSARSANPAAARVLGVVAGSPVEESALLARLPGLGEAIAQVAEGRERAALVGAPLAARLADEHVGATANDAQTNAPNTAQKDPLINAPINAPLNARINATTAATNDATKSSPGRLAEASRYLDVLVTPFGAEDALEARRSVLVVAEDVTDELRTKQRLIQTERLAAIGRMAAHVTHEVRNPLSSIGLNVELLEEEVANAGPEARALLRAIEREIERLTSVTEEYLRLARLPAPRLEPEDLGDLVEEVGRFVAREMESSSVRLAVRLEAALPLVAADEAQVRQALLNLLRNAREAMPGGGEVGLEARSIGGGVEIRVTDAGPGIAAETREHLFEMFYSTKERGTGLGLPLTQQIVAAHGGRIRCEDGASGGSVFSMWFPAVTEASEASDLASTPREAPRPVEAAADAS